MGACELTQTTAERSVCRDKTILIAEDDSAHVMLMKRALKRSNIQCHVDVVPNGAEVMDYLFGMGKYADRDTHVMPDLILLDLNMPKMDGRQVLQVLRSVRSRDRVRLPPVVVLTSSNQDVDINHTYDLGARSYIHKPVEFERFTHAVEQTVSYWLGLNEPPSSESLDALWRKPPR